MKLISLSANMPSFHTIYFNEGMNIIVGKQISPYNKNDGNTYNGVGKSLIVHLIHFCLGSNKIDSFNTKLKDWEFTLVFKIDDKKYYCRRSTNNQSKINFSGEILSEKELRQKLLSLCFDIDNPPKNMTWNTLFSRFVRRYRASYTKYDTFLLKETDYSKILNNCYLLGIDYDLITSKKVLRDKQQITNNTEKGLKKDSVFKQYYMGKNDADIDVADIEYQIEKLKHKMELFQVSSNYHELEVEANEKSINKKSLENIRFLINCNIHNIENSLQENSEVTDDISFDIYKSANVEIPEMVKVSVDAVQEFHEKLLKNRNILLNEELKKQKKKLQEIDEKLLSLGNEMDELLQYLNTHGALEEYLTLNNQLETLKSKLDKIQEYQKILKMYHDATLNIKEELIAQCRSTDDYLQEKNEDILKLRTTYVNYAKQFYPKKRSVLTIKNNTGENMLRYILDAHIEDDSSDGVNEVKIFCFDLLLLLCKKGKIRFMVHDSRIFANMDPRQREMVFKIMAEICKDNEYQYICSVNEDSLLSIKELMSQSDYERIVNDNIIMQLKDDSPESKLLGIQVDIDLENNSIN